MDRHGSYWKIPEYRKNFKNQDIDNSYYINSQMIEENKYEDENKTGKFQNDNLF